MHITDIFQSRKYRAVLRAYTFMTDDGRIWTMPSPFAMPSVESTTIKNALRLVQVGSITAFYNNIVEVSITASRDAATSIMLRMPYESNASKYGTGTHATQELQVLRPQTFVDGDKYFITPSLFKGSYLYRLDIVPHSAIDWSASEASIRQAINSLSDKETYFMYLTDSTITRTTTEKYMDLNFVDTSYLFQTNMNISYPEQEMYEKLFKTGKDAELLSLLQSNGVYPPVWDGWTLPNLLLALMHYAGMLPPDWTSVSAINKSGYVEYKVYWDVYEAVVLRIYGELNSLRLPYSPEYPNPDDTLSDGYYFKTNPYDTISNMLENLMQTLGVNWRIDPATGVLQVFFDSNNIVHEGTLSESLMSSFGYNYNDTNLRNAVTVLGQEYGAGKMYSAYVQNNTSIRHFGRRHMVFQHPLILSDSQAEAVASNILNQYAFNVGSLNIDTLYAFRLNPYNRLNVKLSDDNITMGTGSTPLLEVDTVSKNIDWLGKGTSRLSLINIVKKVYIPLEELFGGREIQINDLSKFKFTWNSPLLSTDIKSLLTTNIVRVPVGRRVRLAWRYVKTYTLTVYGYDGNITWFPIATKGFQQIDTPGYKVIEKDIDDLYDPDEDTWTGFSNAADIESEFSALCSADGTGTHTSIKYLQVSKDALYSEGVFNYTISLNYTLTYSSISDRLKRPVLAFVAIPLLNFEISDGQLIYDVRSLPNDSYRYALLQEVVFKLDFWKKNLDKAPVNLTELPFPEWAGVNLDVESPVSFKANTWYSCQGVFNDQQTVAFNLLCEKSGNDALLISRKFLLVAFIKAWDSNIKQYRWVPIGDYILIDVPPSSKGLTLYWDGNQFKLSVFENMPFFGNDNRFQILSDSSHSTLTTEGSYVYNYIKDNCIVDMDQWKSIDRGTLGKNVFDYKLKYITDIPYRLSMLVFKYMYIHVFIFGQKRALSWACNRLELVRLDLSPTQDYKSVEVTLGDLDYNRFAELSSTEPNVFTLTFVASPFQYYDAHFYLDNGYCLMQQSAVTHGSEPSEDTNTYPAYFWAKDTIISDSRKHVAGVTGFNFN